MSIKGMEFIKRFEEYFPLALAEEGDPVGLHIGTLVKDISKVMITLDVRPEVVAEAIEKKVDLIVAKHPPIFRPAKRLNTDNPQNKMYGDLLKHDIAVYAAHTNMDIVENGLNDWFCEELGIYERTYLKETHTIPYYKLAVNVPVEQGEEVRQALAKAGAGEIGEYEACSFSYSGEGRFKPVNNANPTIGRIGELEVVNEEKIEVIFLEPQREKIVQALLAAHPYEEPVYDIYQLANEGKKYGIGRIGLLPEAVTLEDFVATVKKTFSLDGLRLISDNPSKKIQRVAICGGSGEKFYRDALRKKADVYLTGDVYYHTAHDMIADGLSVIDPGHHIEQLCIPKIWTLCNQWKEEYNWAVTFLQSEENTNPFSYY